MKTCGNLSSFFLTAAAFLVLYGCPAGNQHLVQKPDNTVSLKVYKIKSSSISRVVTGFGNLAHFTKADITSAVDGTIGELFADAGDTVEKGQLLASLRNIQLEIRLKQAEAAVFSAESELELAETKYKEGRLQVESRIIAIEKSEINLKQKKLELEHQRRLLENKTELLKIGGAAEEEVSAMQLAFSALETEAKILEKDIQNQNIGFRDQDIRLYGYSVPHDLEEKNRLLLEINSLSGKSELKAAEARCSSAETELESAKALLSETSFTSPIKGIVGERYAEPGERIKSGTKLFTVFNTEMVDFVFAVPEEIGILLETGQTVPLSIDALGGREFTAAIRLISPAVDPRSGNLTIKAVLDNKEGLLKPGMFSRFSLTYGPDQQKFLIPPEALAGKDGNRAIVFKLSGGRVYPRSIAVETSGTGGYILIEGLEEGDEIVLEPPPMLKEGDKINAE